jgi:Tfp pilus assembly protein PilX
VILEALALTAHDLAIALVATLVATLIVVAAVHAVRDAPSERIDADPGEPFVLHPTSDAALIRAEREHGDHHPECSVHDTRWCDCKGLPRDVTDEVYGFVCTRTDIGRAA